MCRSFLVALLLLAGCAITPAPKTADEFRAGVLGNAMFSQHETVDVNRDVATVVNDIRQQSEKCLNVTTTSTVAQGLNVSASRATYNPGVVARGSGKSRFTLQVVWSPKPVGTEMPNGGYFLMVADIEHIAAGKTRLSLYGPTRGPGNAAYEAVKSWGSGRKIACPDMR